jgi:very-short-patch-repair endonuclease
MNSSMEETIYAQLKTLFPHALIHQQYHISVEKQSLYFDFYLPNMGLVIECQGEQHYKFVARFHGDKSGFKQHKIRDLLKKKWVKDNKKKMLEIEYNAVPKSPAELFSLIKGALSG